jgi:hypothetical protein
MNSHLQVVSSALGIAMIVVASPDTPASAQALGRAYEPRGSAYWPYYNLSDNPSYPGTTPYSQRDPHNDR